MKGDLSRIRVILVEPAGPLNVGSAARVMKNMTLEHLVIVNPACDYLGEEARRMAMHGIDVLERAQVVKSLPEALVGCHRAIATTGKPRSSFHQLEPPSKLLPSLLTPGITSALIFGREDKGLSNEELNYAQGFLYIPTNPEYPSLNLAQAVAICTYEMYQMVEKKTVATSSISQMATIDSLEGYYQELKTLLLEIGYLYPHTANARMEKFRHLFSRANLSSQEVAMLRGIISQMRWAIHKP